jgi:hypothetical protein
MGSRGLDLMSAQPLILKRASANRPSGQWRDDDYDVLENGVVVGRIFMVPVAPQGRPWMWASGHNGHIRRAAHGYEQTREAAMVVIRRDASNKLQSISVLTKDGTRTAYPDIDSAIRGYKAITSRY